MKLKGTNNGTSSTRNREKRSIEFKVRVYALKVNEAKSAKEALEIGCREFDGTLTDGMVAHPHSFLNMYKNSIAGFINKGDADVIKLVREAGLADEDEEQEAEQPEAEVETEAQELQVEDDEDDVEDDEDDVEDDEDDVQEFEPEE